MVIEYLECDCCGQLGAESDERGFFYDGQPLTCGCSGQVSCDSENPAEIDAGECPCAENWLMRRAAWKRFGMDRV